MKIKDEKEIREALKTLELRKSIIGIGGTGLNIVRRAAKVGIHGIDLFAMDVNAPHLDVVPIENKLLIGKNTGDGYTFPSEGLDQEERDFINDIMKDTDIAFLVCGLGGKTGTTATPMVAEIAKEHGTLVFVICVIPFKAQGTRYENKANEALGELEKIADTVVSIKNDKLLKACPDVSMTDAFSVLDELIVRFIKGVIDPTSSDENYEEFLSKLG